MWDRWFPVSSRGRHFLALTVLSALAFAAYCNSFQAGFVLDNKALIVDDTRLRAASAENLGLILHRTYRPGEDVGQYHYRPVTTLSYLFNYSVLKNGVAAAGYHWINLLLHILNAYLVYLLAARLLGRFGPAVFTAALWALHPICTESVTNIAGRADELAALSVLSAILLYIGSIASAGWRKVAWLTAMMPVVFLGVLAKENAAIIPGLAMLYDFTFGVRGNWRRLAAYLAFAPPFLVAWGLRAAAVARAAATQPPFLNNPLFGADFLAARLTAIKVLGNYLWLLLWPMRLSCDYSYNQVPLFHWRLSRWEDWKALVALALMLGICGVAAGCYRRHKAVFFFAGFSALALFPASNLLVLIASIMAERFLYLPAVGAAGCLVMAVYAGCRRLSLDWWAAPVLLAAIAGAFGVRTYLRNPDWRDDETLWTAAVAVSPNSYKTHLGLELSVAQGELAAVRVDETLAESEKAMSIVSDLPAGWSAPAVVFAELGRNYARMGDSWAGQGSTRERQALYEKALEVLLRGERVDREAAATERRQELARGKRPDEIRDSGFAPLYDALGLLYRRLGKPQEAVEVYLYQRRLDPAGPEPYRGLAGAYLDLGRTEDAAIALLEAGVTSGWNRGTAAIAGVYDKMDPGGCAVVVKQGQPTFNPDCPMVRRHLCAAMLDLMKAGLAEGRSGLATSAKETARNAYGCAMEPFETGLR
jgi:tetratricopeptide (TPR) repeat protein